MGLGYWYFSITHETVTECLRFSRLSIGMPLVFQFVLSARNYPADSLILDSIARTHYTKRKTGRRETEKNRNKGRFFSIIRRAGVCWSPPSRTPTTVMPRVSAAVEFFDEICRNE